jgi:hypothetical protein
MQTDFVEKDDDDFGHQLDTHGQGMNTHGYKNEPAGTLASWWW